MRRRRGSIRIDPLDPYETVRVNIPKGLLLELTNYAIRSGQPLSRIVCYAIYNEMEAENPFEFDTGMPHVPFIENQYTDEARKIFKYLNQFPNGIGLDGLILARFDMKLQNTASVLLGYRELLEAQMIELVEPSRKKFDYPKGYKYVRARGLDQKKLDAARKARIEKADKDFREFRLAQTLDDNDYGKD